MPIAAGHILLQTNKPVLLSKFVLAAEGTKFINSFTNILIIMFTDVSTFLIVSVYFVRLLTLYVHLLFYIPTQTHYITAANTIITAHFLYATIPFRSYQHSPL